MSVAETLRALRLRAGLSMKELAVGAGFKGQSSYQRYEDPSRYRREHLPLHIVRRLAPVLATAGVPAGEVFGLAGLPATDAQTPPPPGLPEDLVRTAIMALARYLAETKSALSPAEQADLVLAFCNWFKEAVAAGTVDPLLTVPQAVSYLRLMRATR